MAILSCIFDSGSLKVTPSSTSWDMVGSAQSCGSRSRPIDLELCKGESIVLTATFLICVPQPMSLSLVSTRANTHATGTIRVKIGFVDTSNLHNFANFREIFQEFVKRSRPSLTSAPPVCIRFFQDHSSC